MGFVQWVVLVILVLVLLSLLLFFLNQRWNAVVRRSTEYEADVIVIGAGAAGAVIMNQLSEQGRFSVLGLEAGANRTDDAKIKAVGLSAFLLPATDPEKYFWPGWKQTVSQPGLNGRVADWTTGLIVGGGSSINGLYYGRGSTLMYSEWAGIANSANWSVAEIDKAFQELETYQGLTITAGERGTKGPVNVLQTPTIPSLATSILLPSLQSALPDIPVVQDYNSPTVQNCIDPRAQWFIDPTGTERVSSATAFLGPNVMTPDGYGVHGHNLRLLTQTTVAKIEMEKPNTKDGRWIARRVWFLQNGKLVKARARRAIVVSSGINSSKILELSGIGSPERLSLRDINIPPTVSNRAVGENLQNHPTLFITLLADPNDNGIPSGA